MSVNGLLTVAEYAGLVKEYQETQSNEVFERLHTAVYPVIVSVTKSKLSQVYGQGYDENDFYSEAYRVLWQTALDFDGSRGSSYLSYFKQHLKWGINDNVIKHYSTKARKSERTAYSMSWQEESAGAKVNKDYRPNNMAQASQQYAKPIYSDIKEFNSSQTVLDILSEYRSIGTTDDVLILIELIRYILRGEVADPDSKHVNEMLYGKFPELPAATVRKKKERALTRFKEYCLDKGMTEDLENIEDYCHIN